MKKRISEQQYLENFKQQTSGKKNSEHHITPDSRGGSDTPENKVLINETLHEKYHDLFINRTPEEILEFLVTYFWGGRVTYLHTYLKRLRESGGDYQHFLGG